MVKESETRLVVVAGDVTLDWNLARNGQTRRSTSIWNPNDKVDIHWQRGGASLLADLLERVSLDLCKENNLKVSIRQPRVPQAARGTDGRTYPWGESIDSSLANYLASGFGGPVQTGSYPNGKSPYGALDMAGNGAEWTGSHAMGYPYYSTDRRENIGNSFGQNGLAVRGGSWNTGADVLRSFHREKVGDNIVADTIGFRCASSTRP